MFGDMMKMMGQLKEAKKMAEETKQKLAATNCEGISSNGLVRVTISGSVDYRGMSCEDVLWSLPSTDIHRSIEEAFKEALGKAKALQEEEMKKVTSDMMPAGMDKLFGQ